MEVWTRILECIGEKLSRQSFETWFKPIVFKRCTARSLRLIVPDKHFRSLFPESLLTVLHEAVYEVAHTHLGVYTFAARAARHSVGVLGDCGQVILLCMREGKHKAEHRTMRASGSKAPMNLFTADTSENAVAVLKREATAELSRILLALRNSSRNP